MKVGDKFTREIYPGNIAEITVTSVDEDGYRYAIEFQDGRKGSATMIMALCRAAEP